VASIRQVHKVKLSNGAERIIKIKRPEAINTISIGLDSLTEFVGITRRDSSLLKGIVLPDDLLSELKKTIDNEVLSSGDQEEQNRFHEQYEGIRIANKRLYIPTVDDSNSTSIVTLETLAPGEPLGTNIEALSAETREGLLKFFLELMFDKGKYHADPHPGNILESEDSISLVDFGMVGELDPNNRYILFDIIQKIFFNKEEAISALLAGHLHNGGKLEDLNLGVVRQELEFFFNTSFNNGDTFQDMVLRLLNTLENLKISLPSQIKIIVKTISQMGYLIKGHESLIISMITNKIIQNTLTMAKDAEYFDDLHEQVKQFLERNMEVEDTAIIRLAKGSLVRQTAHQETVWETPGNIELDPTKIKNFLMLDLGAMKVGILPGRRNYEVFRGGRWVSIEELVFGK
jgi:predicted unusual protein kinase regulating ubiquinone biosynthesis (AarF/ABC1/UbiB family)